MIFNFKLCKGIFLSQQVAKTMIFYSRLNYWAGDVNDKDRGFRKDNQYS